VTSEIPKPAPESTRYELLRPLGEGGVGAVYVALDRETGEQVALKKLSRMTPLNVLRFKREFRALANIGHRNLVKLYELEHAQDGWFLTMELVQGVELRHALDEPGDDDAHLEKLIDAFRQLAQGVQAIHQAGMLHRDLKPSNVMLEPSGRVVVLDFGLVRELGETSELVTLHGSTSGTPGYMPPEQARGEQLSEASDWYAFGAMLYEALSGVLPFEGRNILELIERKLHFDAPSLPRNAGTQALGDLCADLLQRNPRERPDAQAILAVLSQNSARDPQEARPSTLELNSLAPGTQTTQSGAELFGRDLERLQLEAALTTCLREHMTVAVHVRGPSGSGKSSLVQAFLADSVPLAAGATAEPLVLRARCYEREAMPFKSIDGAVDALATYLMKLDDVQAAYLLPTDVAALSALFPVFERVPAVQQLLARGKRSPHTSSLQLRRRAEEGFRSLLGNVASQRPLVIWIDDLQWGDLDSTQVLQDWLKTPADAPMLLLLSYRSDEITTSTCLSTLLSPEARNAQLTEQHELELRPLKDSDVHALCWKRLGGHASSLAPVVAQIVRDAKGNPFLATQLAALARAKLARGDADLSAFSVELLVQHTSSLLSEPALQLLRVLSVAGRPLLPRIALKASGLVSEQRARIHELQTLRLVRARYVNDVALLEVYHDSVRSSIQRALTEDERTRIHEALLRTALDEGTHDAAWLHELALNAGEHEQARKYGVLAAETASANLAFERAAELYERCVQLTAADAERAQLLQKLALASVRSRRGARAADAYLEASKLVPEPERLGLLQLAASHLLRSGRFEKGEALVQEVLRARDIRLPDTEAGLYAAIAWERTRVAVLERFVNPQPDAVFPAEEQKLARLYGMLALDTQCYAPLRATLFQMRAARLCFQHGGPLSVARALCMNAALASLAGDASADRRVDKLLSRAAALIDREQHPDAMLELYSARATCSMFLGRMPQVIEAARLADALYETNSAGDSFGGYFYIFLVRSTRIIALQYLGRHKEAADNLRQLIEDAAATSNRCAVLQATMARSVAEQAESCCIESRARLDAELRELPGAEVSVLHVVHMLAVFRVAAMTAEHAWAFEAYAQFKPRYDASPLKRSAYLAYGLHVQYARLLLNHHVASGATDDPAQLIDEHQHWLETKAPLPLRTAAPLRLQARIAIIRGKREAAAALLEQSQQAHAELAAADEVERDRYARGLLLGGAAGAKLTAAAIAALRDLGVNAPERELRGYYPELLRDA
jgi:eukaryotic-like serine/threonine-protein kinase